MRWYQQKLVCAKFGTNTKFGTDNVVLTTVENLTFSVPCLALRWKMVPGIKFVTQMRIKILVLKFVYVYEFWYQNLMTGTKF